MLRFKYSYIFQLRIFQLLNQRKGLGEKKTCQKDEGGERDLHTYPLLEMYLTKKNCPF